MTQGIGGFRGRRGLIQCTLAIALACAAAACGRRPADVARQSFDPDSIPEAYARSTAALLVPGATRAVQVTPAGDLYNGEWITRFTLIADGAPVPAPHVIAYEDRWLPVAHWTRTRGALRFEFEATALPAPKSVWQSLRAPLASLGAVEATVAERRSRIELASHYSDTRLDSLVVRAARRLEPRAVDAKNLFVTLEVRITNIGRLAHDAGLTARLARVDSLVSFVALDAVGPAAALQWTDGTRTPALGWSDAPARGQVVDAQWRLSPGRTQTLRFIVPAYRTPGTELSQWATESHAAATERARAWWIAQVDRGVRLSLGDRDVERAVRAARVVLLGCREERDGHWVPLGSPFQYRDVWLRDGSRAVVALALHGYIAEARAMLPAFEEFQWPHGPFVSQKAQLDGTGQALWTYEQTLLRSEPARDLDRYAESALRAWRWCERRRATSDRDPTRGRAAADVSAGGIASHLAPPQAHLVPGMLPFADPNDNELVRAQLVGTDAWAIAGYRATSRLLKAAGRAREARTVDSTRVRYVEAFARALEQSGSADVPPSWQNLGLDWGNLSVVYPCAALDAHHPRFASLAERYWREAGGPGIGHYRAPTLLHGYVAADLGTWALLEGRRDEADHVLAALLAWRSASGGAGETFSATGDYGTNLPPHATTAAALLTLVRNALVFDDADTLALTLGARASWWRDGRVADLPTRWGVLDLEFHRHGDVAEWRWTPVPVWTSLTLPPGTHVAAALTRGLRPGARNDVVLAAPGTRVVRLKVAG